MLVDPAVGVGVTRRDELAVDVLPALPVPTLASAVTITVGSLVKVVFETANADEELELK